MSLIIVEECCTRDHCVGFVCDRCTTRFGEDEPEELFEIQEMFHWKHTGGYASIWGDGTTVEVTLCQNCCYVLFREFIKQTINK